MTDYEPWEGYPDCPCGIVGCVGWKLSIKTGHVVRDCLCASCRNSRNVRKGKRGQAKGHKALGGQGFTPGNEESVGGYDVRVQVEWKTGQQVPASFAKFVGSEWTRHAMSQADRARRVGDGAMPAIGIVAGSKTWLVVECDRDMDGRA